MGKDEIVKWIGFGNSTGKYICIFCYLKNTKTWLGYFTLKFLKLGLTFSLKKFGNNLDTKNATIYTTFASVNLFESYKK